MAINMPTRLIIDPKTELVFTGPFDRIVSSTITLTNPTEDRICFKVKTTVPKSYCVKPSSGVVEPGSNMRVEVLLQPINQLPADRNKHKFMVQTVICPKDCTDLEKVWKTATPQDFEDTKLRCIMRAAEELIQLSPATNLVFEGPFNRIRSDEIRITNVVSQNIAFKIQLTSPKRYAVQPANGVIKPGEVQLIQVSLQPFEYDSKEKYRERLLVQYAPTTSQQFVNTGWFDGLADKGDYHLKCIYTMPGEPAVAQTPKVAMLDDIERLKMESMRLRKENEALKNVNERFKELHRLPRHPGLTAPSANNSSQSGGGVQDNPAILTLLILVIAIISAIFGKMFL